MLKKVSYSQSVKKYSFKSSGELENLVQKVEEQKVVTVPIGIKTPLESGIGADGLFKMHTDMTAQINDNLRNLILTNHGERLGHYDFGANIQALTFELGTDEIDGKALKGIGNAIKKYMPFVQPITFETVKKKNANDTLARVGIKMTYNVPQLKLKEQVLMITLFSAG